MSSSFLAAVGDRARDAAVRPRDDGVGEGEPSSKRQRVFAGSVLTFKVLGVRSGVPRFAVHQSASLEAVVSSAFDFALERELGESLDAHLWRVSVLGKTYSSSAWDPEFEAAHFAERTPSAHETSLSNLELSPGDMLHLEYDFGTTSSFDFVVAGIVPARDASDLEPQDLGLEPQTYDGPIVSEEEAVAGKAFRAKVEAYLAGENLWAWNQRKYVRPTAPEWGGGTQTDAVGVQCLLEAGLGFAKAWKDLVEPCLLLRTKSAASMFWYKTKKEIQSYGISWVATFEPEPSPSEYLRKARTLLRIRREAALQFSCEKKPPVLESHHTHEVVFYEWFAKAHPPSSGHIYDKANREYLKQLKAQYEQVPMAQKVEAYCRLRPVH